MYKKVEVIWLDSESLDEQGWHQIADVNDFCEDIDMTCTTCGYLIFDTVDYIAVALSISLDKGEPNLVDGLIKIPRCSIIKIKYWKESKKVKDV